MLPRSLQSTLGPALFHRERVQGYQSYLMDTASIEREATALRGEMAVVDELIRQGISQNASMAINQEDYQQR